MGLFSIPMFGISRSKEWVVLCRRKDLMNKEAEYLYKNCRKCAEHFEDIMFANDLKNRLQPQAKPTLFNVQNAPPTVGSKRRAIQKVAESHSKGKIQYKTCRGQSIKNASGRADSLISQNCYFQPRGLEWTVQKWYKIRLMVKIFARFKFKRTRSKYLGI